MEQIIDLSKIVLATEKGEEIGFCNDGMEADLDAGDTNDFEITMDAEKWDEEKYYYNNRVFIPETEYGGMIKEIEVQTNSSMITVRGPIWRGMLQKKIVVPPSGSTHLILNGELNSVLRELVGNRFGSLFVVPEINTGIMVSNWQVDRYVTLYSAIMKLLESFKQRLQISYYQPEGNEYGYVTLKAVSIVDYSDEIEYSQDGKVHFSIRDYRGGVNHLICIGIGENEERIVRDMYIQKDGTIGTTQYYFGLDCIEDVYEYTSADADTLWSEGLKRFQELRNYKQIEVTVDDTQLEVGDIIGGYEQITDTKVKKPIIGKILRVSEGKASIEYKVKGDD